MFNKTAILLTPLLLLGLLVEKLALLTPEDPGPYHVRVREAVLAIPRRAGAWQGVDDVDIPEPAQKLLRPNSLLARRYARADGNAVGTLLVVHCGDSRDLGGHHPPVCYPATGWTGDAAVPVEIEVADQRIPAIRYEFSRRVLGEENHRGEEVRRVVYAFFVLPGSGAEREMAAVRRAAADYRMRRFGAAQVQVVLPDAFSPAAEREIVEDLVRLALPAIRVIADRRGESGP